MKQLIIHHMITTSKERYLGEEEILDSFNNGIDSRCYLPYQLRVAIRDYYEEDAEMLPLLSTVHLPYGSKYQELLRNVGNTRESLGSLPTMWYVPEDVNNGEYAGKKKYDIPEKELGFNPHLIGCDVREEQFEIMIAGRDVSTLKPEFCYVVAATSRDERYQQFGYSLIKGIGSNSVREIGKIEKTIYNDHLTVRLQSGFMANMNRKVQISDELLMENIFSICGSSFDIIKSLREHYLES